MAYSACLDGASYVPSALFAKKERVKDSLSSSSFVCGTKRSQKCKAHVTAQYHQEAFHSPDSFLKSVITPETRTVSLILR